MAVRTDLALEAQELWQKSAGEQTKLEGVIARTQTRRGIRITTVRILDEKGSMELKKPQGTYVTLELGALSRREKNAFNRAALALADEIRKLLPTQGDVLVAGLGNDAVTPDAVGPQALRSLIITRHLKSAFSEAMEGFRNVSAIQPGVLGTTGVESVEIVRGISDKVRPALIVVIDALAAGEPSRLCSSVQLADSGIVPGSGVGNSRAAFDRQSLGVPVLAIGVPTVLDAGSLLEQCGVLGTLPRECAGMVITPRDIDARVQEIARVIAYGLDMALHPGLTLSDVPCFLP